MEQIPVPERDPSVGTVTFTAEEISTMHAQGMTDAQIAEKKRLADQGIAEKKIGEELRDSGIEIVP